MIYFTKNKQASQCCIWIWLFDCTFKCKVNECLGEMYTAPVCCVAFAAMNNVMSLPVASCWSPPTCFLPQTLMIRDWWMCMIISVMFEFLEYSLEHQLPNFSECWWDHVCIHITALTLGLLSHYLMLSCH